MDLLYQLSIRWPRIGLRSFVPKIELRSPKAPRSAEACGLGWDCALYWLHYQLFDPYYLGMNGLFFLANNH